LPATAPFIFVKHRQAQNGLTTKCFQTLDILHCNRKEKTVIKNIKPSQSVSPAKKSGRGEASMMAGALRPQAI
jgi:hypothetical protein